MAPNPLKKFARVPKIFIELPTEGSFYPEGLLRQSADNTVGIMATTARDDMLLNTPDALLNSDAIFNILKSCVVDLADADKLLVPDVHAMIMAIRYASYGNDIKFQTICPNTVEGEPCLHEQEVVVKARDILDHTVTLSKSGIEPCIRIKQDKETTIVINMQPSPYMDATKAAISLHKRQRVFQLLQTNESITEEDRNKMVKDAFDELAKFQHQTLLNSIESIDIVTKVKDEDDIVVKVTDKDQISEYLEDCEKTVSDQIHERLSDLNTKIGIPDEIPVVCEKCGHEYTMEVQMDHSTFFQESSSDADGA